jgi:hypothetical protein
MKSNMTLDYEASEEAIAKRIIAAGGQESPESR